MTNDHETDSCISQRTVARTLLILELTRVSEKSDKDILRLYTKTLAIISNVRFVSHISPLECVFFIR